MIARKHTWTRRLLATVLVPLVVFGFGLISAQPADAARGGRMGGGSFRAPSMPRTGGRSYGGGYGGGNAYHGKYNNRYYQDGLSCNGD